MQQQSYMQNAYHEPLVESSMPAGDYCIESILNVT